MDNKKESSVQIEDQELVFSSGDRVMLRHVNSITVTYTRSMWPIVMLTLGVMTTILAFEGEMAITRDGGGILNPIFVMMPIAFFALAVGGTFLGKKWWTAVHSSSGQSWLVRCGHQDQARDFADELQSTIREVFETERAAEATTSVRHSDSIGDELLKLKGLLDSGAINRDEFEAAKAGVLRKAA